MGVNTFLAPKENANPQFAGLNSGGFGTTGCTLHGKIFASVVVRIMYVKTIKTMKLIIVQTVGLKNAFQSIASIKSLKYLKVLEM